MSRTNTSKYRSEKAKAEDWPVSDKKEGKTRGSDVQIREVHCNPLMPGQNCFPVLEKRGIP